MYLMRYLFNRNILYCKYQGYSRKEIITGNLIGTFCIVNLKFFSKVDISQINLIGTFYIVNTLQQEHWSI